MPGLLALITSRQLSARPSSLSPMSIGLGRSAVLVCQSQPGNTSRPWLSNQSAEAVGMTTRGPRTECDHVLAGVKAEALRVAFGQP